ncbi:Flp pilus assembly protein CpaB [Vibrio campbellii]|uniref:Flp pilus assembly protein CpaB n=1 Tax=Vibrio campbellii TaxID=680 RepID=UPI000CD33F9B|nr:Flp pilus assembly protein CpaB [Vibrio campbellii]AUV85313.1 Flp pilus assembly protein CpaB [Vibrio campbellii]
MRSRIGMVFALLALLVGGIGIYSHMTAQPQQQNPTVSQSSNSDEPQAHYVQVWRAKSNLERGTPIEIDDVQKEQMLLNIALEEGINSDIKLDFSPSTLLSKNIEAGKIVFSEYQVKENDPRYIDLLITEGKEPYSLLVSTRNLVKGYIRPGTNVDVLSVGSPKENLADEDTEAIDFSGVNAQLILRNVKVLSVGNTKEPVDSRVKSNVSSEDDHQIVIVVEVDPSEIAKLSIAQKTMHLEVYRSHRYKEPVFAEVRDVIGNYSGVTELRGSARQSAQGEEL